MATGLLNYWAFKSVKPALVAHLALITLSLLPLVLSIPASLNIVVTASLAVYAGAWRSMNKRSGEGSWGADS